MPFDFWGTTEVAFYRPETLAGYLILLVYVGLTGWLLWLGRDSMRRLRPSRWALFFGLALLGVLCSQLFPLRVSVNQIPFYLTESTPILLLLAVPLLLAGLLLPPALAMLVGMLTGLGWALGASHLPFDLFHFGFAGWISAVLLQQNYTGRLYGALRNPILAGIVALTAADLLVLLSTFVTNLGLGALSALDVALYAASMRFWPLMIAAVVGGGIVWLLSVVMPSLTSAEPLVPSDAQRTVRGYLLRNFLLFAVSALAINVAIVFFLTIYLTTELLVDQMAYNANAISAEVVELQQDVQLALAGLDNGGGLASADGSTRARMLRQLDDTSAATNVVLLVDANGNVTSSSSETPSELTDAERSAVSAVQPESGAQAVVNSPPQPDLVMSLVVPVTDATGTSALVSRVPQATIADLLSGLPLVSEAGLNFIVDRANAVVAQTSAELETGAWLLDWNTVQASIQRELAVDEELGGQAYLVLSPRTNTRELVYAAPPTSEGWTVVSAVPYSMVLQQAMRIGLPLVLLLGLVTALFYARLANFGQELTRPITDLADASRTIAAGGSLTTDVVSDRDDEIGRLSRSFDQMQRALKQRLDDLSLLLSVSQDVSTSVKLNESMPVILQGMLRATTATGARAVVVNPSGGFPLTFGEGPLADALSMFDRRLMTQMRHESVLELTSPALIRETLRLDEANLPVRALLALPLLSDSNFLGVLFLGYSQAHQFDSAERNLIYTLVGQASVVVDNAHLFIKAESGRRRLAAVLASTTDAVIVTDQTERVLLLNRAMEQAFLVNAKQVINRPVADVVKSDALVEALTSNEPSTRNLEIQAKDRNTYYANVSKIISHDGQVLGRVAVLHDITHLKEADKMKSEFVSTVSHDLRSPLTFMRGYATMIPMVGSLNDRQMEYNEKILTGIEQMSDLVDDLLDLGKIEAGVELQFDEIDVTTLLHEIADDHLSHVQQVGNRLVVEIAPDLPPVRGDARLLRQAITNLLMNSCKYAPNSGVITLGGAQLGNEVILHVADNGPGIAKQDQMHLFEKFYRVKRAGNERIKGSGLGLAIVKSIAERHGGEAWCSSQLGKGSTFSISLPVEQGG